MAEITNLLSVVVWPTGTLTIFVYLRTPILELLKNRRIKTAKIGRQGISLDMESAETGTWTTYDPGPDITILKSIRPDPDSPSPSVDLLASEPARVRPDEVGSWSTLRIPRWIPEPPTPNPDMPDDEQGEWESWSNAWRVD